MGKSLRKPVDTGSRVCTSTGKAPIRRRDEDTAPDPDRLGYELPLALASADVLDDGVRKDDVERAVGERQRARIALYVRNLRVTGTEAAPSWSPSAVIRSGHG
jgi:hypothetical protein